MTSSNDILRKLGASEIVYDYEIRLKNMILPIVLVFDAHEKQFDLLTHRIQIDQAIQKWKSIHPIFNTKIIALPDPDPSHAAFSNERYFAWASPEKIASLENIKYARLAADNANELDTRRMIDMLVERELNSNSIDAENGLLWKLQIIDFSSQISSKFVLLLTGHHAIIDAKNSYYLVNNLLELIEASIDSSLDKIQIEPFKLGPSIEEKLFDNDPSKLADIKTNEKYEFSPECKIPKEFALSKQPVTKIQIENEARFEFLPDSNNNVVSSLYIRDLQAAKNDCKYTSIDINGSVLSKLLAKCRQTNCKLTGCLNVVAALAMSRLLKRHTSDPSFLLSNEKICFHLLANLRPFFNVGDLNAGYWAVVMNCIVDCRKVTSETDAKEAYRRFWELAKLESDSIHERIKANELIENAKMDTMLLDVINRGESFGNGGSVHFALSNLGALSRGNLKRFRPREFYFCTSLVKNRWSSLIFNGLSSLDNQLSWSVGYVVEFVSDSIINDFISFIRDILESLTAE